MTTRLLVAVVCDVCGAEAGPRFPTPAAADAWMRRHGWESRHGYDWCPACVLLDQLEQLREDATELATAPAANGAATA